MTRDEHRAKCIEAMKEAIDNEAFGRFDSISSDVVEIAFDALHGIAAVCPILSVLSTGHFVIGADLTSPSVLGGDLTNAPEKKL